MQEPIVTPIYFTLGMMCPFFYQCLLLFIIIKLCKTCGAVNEAIYNPEIIKIYGKQRKHQTLINIFGDVTAFVLGHLFYSTLSWLILIPLVILLNLFSSKEGGDIISMICWYMDRFGYMQLRKRYISASPLEKCL